MALPLPSTDDDESVPLAVWRCAQTDPRLQRAGRYVADSTRHPGKMLPALARRIVLAYSQPGGLVVDPMCGIGTTLVEGANLGRRCIGVELERRWVVVARANVHAGLSPPQRRLVKVRHGDSRSLASLLRSDSGAVDLILVSPPYACDAGMIDKRAWLNGQGLCDPSTLNYSSDHNNVGYARGVQYRTAMAAVYAQCFIALKPGGLLVTVTKNMRKGARLIDLAGMTVALACTVGFGYLQHIVALHAAVRGCELTPHPSFWQLDQTRRARRRGLPLHLIAHEDVLVFIKPRQHGRG